MNFLRIGAIFGLVGVVLGAFGAHGLRDRLSPQMLAVFEVGVRYQMYHVFALLFVGLAIRLGRPPRLLTRAGWCFAGGIVVFSGSLYALALTGTTAFGAITPIGGLAFLAGWALVILDSFDRRQSPKPVA